MDANDLRDLRILIVDDERDALNALADIFEDMQCSVTCAASGKEARSALKSQKFDVALLDNRLPDTKGTDLLREIRHSHGATRCIMVTASSDAEDAINALNEGASAYLQKPVDVDAMKSTILEVVSQYRRSAEERRQLRDLDVIREVGAAAMDLDLKSMLFGVLKQAVLGFGADGGAVMRFDEETQRLRGFVQFEFSDQPIEEYTLALGEGLAGLAAVERRLLDVENVLGGGFRIPAYLHRTGIVSALVAPVVSSGALAGIVLIGWRSLRAFTSEDRNLMSAITERLALGYVNAKLYENQNQLKSRIEYLARVSQELNNQIEDIHEVVGKVTRLATERLGDGCSIYLLKPGNDTLETMVTYNRDSIFQRIVERSLRINPVRLGEGIVGQSAVSDQPILANQTELQAAYPNRQYLVDAGINSSIAVPLRAHGRTIGVLSCSSSDPATPLEKEHLSLAIEFADLAAVAVENAILYREGQSKRDELQALFSLMRAVSSTLEEPLVLESVLKGTAQLMNVPVCCVATGDASHELAVVNRELGMSHEVAERMVSALFSAWSDNLLGGREPFYVRNLQAADVPEVASLAASLRFASMMAVPLGTDATHDTVLMVLTRNKASSLSSKADLLATLGNLAGVALSNARSYSREFKIAERVQQWILSTEFGEKLRSGIDGIEIATGYHAALVEASVGGDFYDIIPVAGNRIGLVIGDVSGKGLDAALQTQAAKHTLRAYGLDGASPAEVVRRTNKTLCRMLPVDVFITLFYGVLNPVDRTLVWCNAGHDPPIVCSSNTLVDELPSTGPALGLMTDAEYEERQITLDEGDLLLLYTDGLTEARIRDQFLETAGVLEIVCRHSSLSARDIVRRVYEDVRVFASGHLHDDIALLALKVTGDLAASS